MLCWLTAFIITLASVYYQRATGPTSPLQGAVMLDGQTIRYRLERSHDSDSPQPVLIQIADATVAGEVSWRRYPTDETWQTIRRRRNSENIEAALAQQPPAGKWEYAIILKKGETQIRLPEQSTVVTRFKDRVPAYFLIHTLKR